MDLFAHGDLVAQILLMPLQRTRQVPGFLTGFQSRQVEALEDFGVALTRARQQHSVADILEHPQEYPGQRRSIGPLGRQGERVRHGQPCADQRDELLVEKCELFGADSRPAPCEARALGADTLH